MSVVKKRKVLTSALIVSNYNHLYILLFFIIHMFSACADSARNFGGERDNFEKSTSACCCARAEPVWQRNTVRGDLQSTSQLGLKFLDYSWISNAWACGRKSNEQISVALKSRPG